MKELLCLFFFCWITNSLGENVSSAVKSIDNLWNVTSILPSANNKCPNRQGNLSLTPFLTPFSIYYNCDFSMKKSCGLQLNELTIKTGITLRISNFAIVLPADLKFVEEGLITLGKYRCTGMIDSSFDLIITQEVADNQTKTVGKSKSTTSLLTTETTWADENNSTFSSTETSSTNDISINLSQSTTSLYPQWPRRITTSSSSGTKEPSTRSSQTSVSTTSSDSNSTQSTTSSSSPETSSGTDKHITTAETTLLPDRFNRMPNRTGKPDKRTTPPMDANTTTIPLSTSSLEATSSDGSSQSTTTSNETITSSSDGTTSQSTVTSNGTSTTSTAATSTISENSTVGSTSSPFTTGFDETVTTGGSTDLNITSTVTVTTDSTASSTYPSKISKESTAGPNSTSSSSPSSITRPEEAVITDRSTDFNITMGIDYTTGSTHLSTTSQESTVKSSTQGSNQSTSFEDFASRVFNKTTSSQSTTSDQQSTTVKSSTTYPSTSFEGSSASTTEPTSPTSTVATTSSNTQSTETDSTTFATASNEGQGQTKEGHSSTETGTNADSTLHPDIGNTQNGSDGQTTSRTTSSTAETTGTSTIGQSNVSTSPSTGSTSEISSTGSITRIASSITEQDLSISPSSSSNPSTESTEISRTTAATYSTGTETKSTSVTSTSEKVIPSSSTVTNTTSTDFQNVTTTVSTSASNPTSSFTSQSTEPIGSTSLTESKPTSVTKSTKEVFSSSSSGAPITLSSTTIGSTSHSQTSSFSKPSIESTGSINISSTSGTIESTKLESTVTIVPSSITKISTNGTNSSTTATTSTDSTTSIVIETVRMTPSSSIATTEKVPSIGTTKDSTTTSDAVTSTTRAIDTTSESNIPSTFTSYPPSTKKTTTSITTGAQSSSTSSSTLQSTSIASTFIDLVTSLGAKTSTSKMTTTDWTQNGSSSAGISVGSTASLSLAPTVTNDSLTTGVSTTITTTEDSGLTVTTKGTSSSLTEAPIVSDSTTSLPDSTTAGTSIESPTSDESSARSSTTTGSPSDSSSTIIETSSSSPVTISTEDSRTSSADIWTMETTRESGTSKAVSTSMTSNVQTTSTEKILDQSTTENRPLTTQIIRDSSSSSGTIGSTSKQTAESTPTSSSSNVRSSSKGSTEDSTTEVTEPVIIDILNITKDFSFTGAHSSTRSGTIRSNGQTTSTTQSTSVISSSSTSTRSSSTVSTAVLSTSNGTSENTVSTPTGSTSSTGTDSRSRTLDTTRSLTESTVGAGTTRKSTTIRSSSQISTSTTTSPWRNCSKTCPDGYFEGTSFCYYFVSSSVYQAYSYLHAYSYCKRNIITSLVGPDDFQDDSNLKLFREMYNDTTLDAFWMNGYQSATMWATKSVKMISIFNSTEYHLDTWSVSLTSMVQKSNAICKATKNCSPWTCKTSLIYEEIGYLLIERPADIPDEFPPGTDFLQNCLLTSSSAKITCQNNGEWTPHLYNLVRACKPADESLRRQEKPIPSNGPVRKSCTECYWQGTTNCTETVGGYSCNCKPGWSDFTCYTALNICRKNSCLGRGTCKSFPIDDGDAFNFTCSCSKRWKGKQCQIQIANVTVFGSNTTVPIIFHGSVSAGITATGSLLSLFIKYLAALSWSFESAKDPIDVCQHMRDLFILLGSLSIAVYGRPSVMGITMFSGRVISLETLFLFLMALFMYFMESIFVMDVCLGKNRNQWNVQSDGKRNWRYNKFGVIVLSIFYFLFTLSVAMITEWNGIASNWTTLGLWEEETNLLGFYVGFNSTMLAIFCYLHSTRAGIAATSQGEKYRYMEIIHKEEFTPHPYLRGMNMDRMLKAKRSILGCRFVPLLLNCSVWYTSYCFFFYKGDLDFLCIALSLLVCVFTVVQGMITYSPTMELLLTGVLFRLRFLPDRFVDWLWSGPTPLTRLTRAEVHAAFDQKQILPYPAIPSVEDCSSYLTEEERYWIHRDLTRNYCQMRYDTGNSSEDCIRTLLKPEYTKAIQTIKCKQMKYWLGVWAQKIREEDTFIIQQPRDPPKSKSEETRRARMAATMTEGQIAQEDKQCARYLEVAQALGEQEIIKMGMVFVRKDKNWLDFLINCIDDYPKPHRPENSYQFVTRDQHSEALIYMEKWMKEKALSTDPDDQKAFEEALFDEKRPGFIGPHLAQDYRHLPGAREALEMFYATKQFHREMRKLADECIEYWREAEPKQSKKIKEEVEAKIEAKEQEERNKKEQERANLPNVAEGEEDPNVAVYRV